jgi:threonine dehydrogenase-like Zn-dependent dehydrogenase
MNKHPKKYAHLPEDYARVKVLVAGICGTDISKLSGGNLPAGHTHILGHEFVGTVTDVHSGKHAIQVGDYVAVMPLLSCGQCSFCRTGSENLCVEKNAIGRTAPGAFAEYVEVPLANLHKISSPHCDAYVLADPLAVCIHAFDMIREKTRKGNYLVIGDGTIGSLMSWYLTRQGHGAALIGKHAANVEFIQNLGVKTHRPVVFRDTYDAVFEAVGRNQSETLSVSLSLVRNGGSVVVLGVFCPDHIYPLSTRNLFIREVSLVGSNAYTDAEFRKAIRLISMYRGELSGFISHSFPLSQFTSALEAARRKAGFTMKVVLRPDE